MPEFSPSDREPQADRPLAQGESAGGRPAPAAGIGPPAARPRQPPGLGWRVPVLVLLVSLIGLAMGWLAERQETGLLDSSREEAARTHGILKAGLQQAVCDPAPSAGQAALQRIQEKSDLRAITLLDKAGRVRACTDPASVGRKLPPEDPLCAACHESAQLPTQWIQPAYDDEGEERILRSLSLVTNEESCQPCHAGDGPFLGVLAVDQPMAAALARIADARRALLAVAALTFAVLLTAVFFLHRRLVVQPASAHAAVALENERLYALTITDELTQLYTLRFFQQALAREVENHHRYGQRLSLLMLDLDDFKRVNDENGHPAGDLFLQRLAEVFRDCVRDGDVVCRYGGEEFAVILPGTGPRSAAVVAERIRSAVEQELVETDGRTLRATVSIGSSSCPGDAESARDLVRRADQALYAAKSAGKNRVIQAA